ncbi:hypothetical protein GCM10023194_36840 [Planotetraspora phitsanulokensis]|uniref:DUF4190 domain-containing protein n=1 Tax=Planotetraspora phitsanulokensis TaxID=575192 RepID=A0A8J3U0Q3_9ACTN|nr:DUF4190 domain-containing protein [Planotetraspora phitsanulokensis]GII36189.1 hypothetical protein Pph01_11920 [Planotetraspora phitsanulokensis]
MSSPVPPPAGFPGQPHGEFPGQPGQPGQPGYPGGDPYGYGAVPPVKASNGLAVAGFVLAFLVAPIGFILSIVGLVQAPKRGGKGRGLAIAGIVISLVVTAGWTGLVIVVANTVGKNVATVLDPGCVSGQKVIVDDALKLSSEPAALKKELTSIVSKLNTAADNSKKDDVRKAMTTLAGDYDDLLQALNNKTAPPSDLETRVTKDVNAVVSLCTLGTQVQQ